MSKMIKENKEMSEMIKENKEMSKMIKENKEMSEMIKENENNIKENENKYDSAMEKHYFYIKKALEQKKFAEHIQRNAESFHKKNYYINLNIKALNECIDINKQRILNVKRVMFESTDNSEQPTKKQKK